MPVASRFTPIGQYGLIGDTRTAALVSPDGSIDWLCLPRFDGSPVFGFLVDRGHGGRFAIGVVDAPVTARAYVDRTATIETSFRSATGAAILTDGMILDASSNLRPQTTLVRRIRCLNGEMRVRLLFDPKCDLPGRPMWFRTSREGLVATADPIALSLQMTPHVDIQPGVSADITLRAGETLTAILAAADRQPLVLVPPQDAIRMLDESERWWRRWCADIRYDGPHHETVERSLITLRLLTYAPSGAPVAAPTTSIPAPPGSDGAWDYRYSWPRDASIGIGAFLALRDPEEPRAFLRWLEHATKNTRPRVNVLYTLDGRPGPRERILDGISGYVEPADDWGSTSIVRLGNGAADQHQLDVYGWLVDAAWMMTRAGEPLDGATWRAIASFADFVSDHWREPDSGIWETRDERRHYVHSKLMAWTALDRAARLSRTLPTRGPRQDHWRQERDALTAQIRDHGFDHDRQTYVRAYGVSDLDASLLTLATSGFDDVRSPQVRGTIDAIRAELGAGGALLYRFVRGPDQAQESAFVACSFWLAQALAETDRIDEATKVFEEMCGRAGPLGLYAEQIEPTTGEHQGNFPQALSHAALLQAAAAITAERERFPRSSHI